jgi:N6-L-threonylcarbamoyladenine synthase
MSLDIPLIAVNHMVGHVLAHFIDDENKPKPTFPFLCLTVSGGHTQIVLVKDHLDMEVIGTTIDDAAGEAFDKAAKLLGFPYPGGPFVDKFAQEGNSSAFSFAKPSIKGYDFSFSGLKTSILYFLQKQQMLDPDFIEKNKADLCASIQETVIGILMKKLLKAAQDYGINQLAIAGGVSANSGLRTALLNLEKEKDFQVFIPKFDYCTDNAAMIAITAKYMFEKGIFADQQVAATARFSI